jgi:hypothetical protein
MTFAYQGPRANDIYSTVTANAAARTVTFTIKVAVFVYEFDDYPGKDPWDGLFVRAANLSSAAGPSNFDLLASGPFGYNRGGNGLSLNGAIVLDSPDWAKTDWWDVGGVALPFAGQGTIASGTRIYSGKTFKFTYKLF